MEISNTVTDLVKREEVRQTGISIVYQTLGYPLDMARTLMQLGYEPFPPTERKFIFGSSYLALPNTFQYLKYIKSVDGFTGCFRGLSPKICQGLVANVVYRTVAAQNPFQGKYATANSGSGSGSRLKLSAARSGALIRGGQGAEDGLVAMLKNTGWEVISVACGTIASQPFYVISVRTVAQFVGRETKYNSILSAISTIWNEEGIAGFFSGLTSRLVGDVIYITLSASLLYVLRTYFRKELESSPQIETGSLMVANILSSSFTYQFQVVSAVMAVGGSGLGIVSFPFPPGQKDWYSCWTMLGANKQLKRGSSVIGRYYTGPSIIVNGSKRPTGFYFGPQHPPGLGFRERKNLLAPNYPYNIPKLH